MLPESFGLVVTLKSILFGSTRVASWLPTNKLTETVIFSGEIGVVYNKLRVISCYYNFLGFQKSHSTRSFDFRGLLRHCVKSVRIRSYSGLHFPTFGLNTGKHGPE